MNCVVVKGLISIQFTRRLLAHVNRNEPFDVFDFRFAERRFNQLYASTKIKINTFKMVQFDGLGLLDCDSKNAISLTF